MIKKTHYPLVLSFAAMACPALAVAQTAKQGAEDTQKLEEVTVFGKDFVGTTNTSGTKSDTPARETPQSLSVVSRDLLDSWGAAKLAEALRYTPGVNAEAFGVDPRFTSIVMRGFSADKEGIFRDGLALINPGYIVSYNFEPYGAERIEVPRGPASVLYGQGSPGGLVNFVSKMPKDKAFGELGLEVGNYNLKEGQVDVGNKLNDDGTVSYRLTGLVRDSDSQFDYVPLKRTYLAASGRWQPSDDTSVVFLSSYQLDNTKASQGLPADGTLRPNPNGTFPFSRFTGETTLDNYHRKEYSLGYQLSHRFSDSVRFFQNVRYNDVALIDVTVYSRGLGADKRTITRGAFWNDNELKGLTLDNQLHFTFDLAGAQHKLLTGIDYQDINADVLQNAGGAPGLDVFNPVYGVNIPKPAPFENDDLKLHQLGVYVQDEMKFAEKFIVNLAARFDDSGSHTFSRITNGVIQDQSDNNTSLRAGLVYLLDNGLAPYASYAESFLPSPGVDINGKPFEPETGKQYEVGLKYQPKAFQGLFTLAYFDLTRKNFVDRDENFVLFQLGQASSKGVELEGFAALDNGLSLTGSYSHLSTRNDEFTDPNVQGKEFTHVPKNQAALWLDYNFRGTGLPGLGVGLGARYVAETWSDDPNTIRNPSYSLLDAAIHYEWKNMRFGLNAQNLTNKVYTSSCFVRNSLLCTFGETRQVRGTVKYRW